MNQQHAEAGAPEGGASMSLAVLTGALHCVLASLAAGLATALVLCAMVLLILALGA